MYEREAMASYAEALRYDPHFVMATLKLADKMRGRDPERAASLLASAARYRDDLTEREKLMLRIWEERWGKRDLKVLESLHDEYQRRFPKDPAGFEMRAGFLANAGRMPEAIAEYERLIAVNPNYAIAYNTLGYYWSKKGENGEGRGLPQALPLPRPERREPAGLAGRALRVRGPVRRGRGEPEEGDRDQGRLLRPVGPPRDGRGRPREPAEGGRVLPQGERQRPEQLHPLRVPLQSPPCASWMQAVPKRP